MTDAVVAIEYAAAPNGHAGHGFLPLIWNNGRRIGSTWASTGYDRDEALARAQEMAREEAERYIGDWTVTVGERKTEAA